ncbi:MAG: hypothetical protein MJ240_03575 [Kiritimatiellae bacterium]|nr:hypothetical protein [Kiritimatiellia bacterium]
MKAIIIPYAEREKCWWADEFFPGRSLASLPVCGKPILEYQLDECAKAGAEEVLVLDWGYDVAFANRLGNGSRWGLKLTYTGADAGTTRESQISRHAGFVGAADVKLILENCVGPHKIDSLASYFAANLAVLNNPGDLVLPGYSAEAGVYAGMNVVMRPGVEVVAPVVLGDNVRLERGVHISGGVVLGEGAIVDRHTRLSRSVIFNDTYLGANMDVEGKIVVGRRVIDPEAGVFVDLEDAGLSSDLENVAEKPLPATLADLKERHYTGIGDRVADARLAEVLALIAKDVAAINLPKLLGVYLGGGYGRGEGGSPVYNDLDFFVLSDNASEQEKDDSAVALDVVAMPYAPQFYEGFHADCCRARNVRDFRKDEDRVMIQEFLRGFVPIFGSAESLLFLRRHEPSELPLTEATRYLVNRGMGLLLSRRSGESEFTKVNVNKAVLGAGDAMLISEGRYAWDVRERDKALNNALYSRAVAFKLHPVGNVASWEEAAHMWMDTVDRILATRAKDAMRRTPRNVLRWLKRRRTIGDPATFGMDALTRILLPMRGLLAEGRGGRPIPSEMMKDWEVFN